MTEAGKLITIGISVTFMFHSFFFNSLARSWYLSLILLPFIFYCNQPERQSSRFGNYSLFFLLLTITRSGGRTEIWRSVSISKSQKILCVSFSRVDFRLCTYHLFVFLDFNFSHNSQWINLPTQFCLVLYSISPNLMYSRIM